MLFVLTGLGLVCLGFLNEHFRKFYFLITRWENLEVLKGEVGWHRGEDLSSSDSCIEEKTEGCRWGGGRMDGCKENCEGSRDEIFEVVFQSLKRAQKTEGSQSGGEA